MKKSKKLISTCLTALLIVGSTMSVSAKTDDTKTVNSQPQQKLVNSNVKEGTITVSESDYQTMLKTKEKIYLGNNVWAKLETFDEAVSSMAKSKGISELQAKSQLLGSELTTTSSMLSSNVIPMSTGDIFYVHFYVQFQVQNTGWYPQLDIYAKCQGIYRDFIGIQDLNLIRSYNYISKQFSGKCQAEVLDAKNIYYVINGDFYDNGVTTWTFGGSVNIGSLATLTGSVSGGSGYFGYVYNPGNITNR